MFLEDVKPMGASVNKWKKKMSVTKKKGHSKCRVKV
jgi:hypothetical protein